MGSGSGRETLTCKLQPLSPRPHRCMSLLTTILVNWIGFSKGGHPKQRLPSLASASIWEHSGDILMNDRDNCCIRAVFFANYNISTGKAVRQACRSKCLRAAGELKYRGQNGQTQRGKRDVFGQWERCVQKVMDPGWMRNTFENGNDLGQRGLEVRVYSCILENQVLVGQIHPESERDSVAD